jgi:Ca2+-binding RTX toxin-like protein
MSFHLYDINELYSNASGTVQFIELRVGGANGESRWRGVTLTSSSGSQTHSFSFPTDLPSSATANTTVLVATRGFADLALVTPDFIVPDGFLFPAGGTVDFGGADAVTHGPLPLDGASSWQRGGSTAAATPSNFAGATARLPAALPRVTGTPGDDSLVGSARDELIEGLAGNDSLKGGGGSDMLLGGSGDDAVYSGPGNDTLDGGDGYDYLYFSEATAAVFIDLRSGRASGGAGSDTITGFELVFGSAFNDRFTGNDQAVGFLGGDGNDTITGGAGNDHLEGNGGDDVIDGGDGVDTTAYYSAAFAVVVDLGAGTASGGLGRDRLTSIENVVGSVFGDTLTGSAGDNRIEGSDGDDRLVATAGNDVLDGGNGIDTAAYAGARSTYTLRRGADGVFTVEKPAAAGTDTLPAVERLQFGDTRLALDLDGPAGQVAKLLGAVFGVGELTNKVYVGIGLAYLDAGTSYEQLAALAVEATGRSRPADVVELLWTNLVGSPPSAEQAAPYVAMLDSGTSVGALALLAADSDINALNIDLVGLVQAGIEFQP